MIKLQLINHVYFLSVALIINLIHFVSNFNFFEQLLEKLVFFNDFFNIMLFMFQYKHIKPLHLFRIKQLHYN